MILVAGCLIGMSSAFAETPETLEGRYINSVYDGQYSFQNAWVEIRKSGQGRLELFFNVPCGMKLIPRVFQINQTSSIGGELQLIDNGSNQCYTGQNPSIILFDNSLHITSNPRVWTPGFDGTYKLTK